MKHIVEITEYTINLARDTVENAWDRFYRASDIVKFRKDSIESITPAVKFAWYIAKLTKEIVELTCYTFQITWYSVETVWDIVERTWDVVEMACYTF